MTADRYESCVRQSEFSYKKLSEKEFCSWWWAASHVRRRDSSGRMMVCRKRDAYPVGSMIKCAACGRWSPADKRDQLCIDCRAEADHARFLDWASQWPAEDRAHLFQMHWRRPMPMRHWFDQGMPAPIAAIYCDVSLPEGPRGNRSPIAAADLHDGSPERENTWGNVPSFRESLQRIRDRFAKETVTRNGKITFRVRGRFIYQKVMLPESKNALLREIAYCQATGKVHPRARRIDNPFDKLEVPMKMPGLPFRPEEGYFDRF